MPLLIHAYAPTIAYRMALCELLNARAFSSIDDDVTCPSCLYEQGRFVPLRRLVEHQRFQRMKFEHASGAPYPQGYR